MDVVHTLRSDRSTFDLQADVFLLNGTIQRAAGPDRAYLQMGPETVGLWLTEAPMAAALLTSVLGIADPQSTLQAPWALSWIRNGQLHVRRALLGVDRGAYLLVALAPWEALDRRAHLFGTE